MENTCMDGKIGVWMEKWGYGWKKVSHQGHNSDSSCARHEKVFQTIVAKQFALSDPGFGSVNYVVTGLRCNQLLTDAHRKYDTITRYEQRRVEWVNNHFKRVKSVAKSTVYMHSRASQVSCIFIACGLYNWKKEHGLIE